MRCILNAIECNIFKCPLSQHEKNDRILPVRVKNQLFWYTMYVYVITGIIVVAAIYFMTRGKGSASNPDVDAPWEEPDDGSNDGGDD